MDTVRPCGCKGIRSCLLCEKEYNIAKPDLKLQLEKYSSYVYCPHCDKAWPGWDIDVYKKHPYHQGNSIQFSGVYIKLNFLNSDDIAVLMKALDDIPWEASQSGRRKQNFGPKCNFKRKKLRLGSFNGFPQSTHFVQQKFSEIAILQDFQTVEQCTLEYDPLRGASIDPHIDDCWIWGERIVTVNVMGDSVLTMTPYLGPDTKYNLKYVAEYSTAYNDLRFIENSENGDVPNISVRLPMPEGSLLVLCGASRYKWEHCVLREDVKSRRICLAYRELTPPYLNNSSNHEEVKKLLQRVSIFR
ncbi:PREDICTED: alpha-ketoglutarate-dependent dioxygenase alkB homolog 4 [Dufourea novaeangliae]|uniref:Putative alpha-ketoglutarate-dependent dioxygenase ABH4 n=1 Tax=Dufourea novaeangliae TaxID=178035 RepID=A0A154PJG9_DUFNO|nr:PREDICTED: alpha-ketoglutarate-dependent dioxygenase alkB homolog 4 [Dufourea novaeangliae]KZC11624.1 putative alpha-ketoglutarate-dependent dioxygenase ABH4 [Dufourea novaeangliae]